jgi:hypothetical protein
MFRKDYIEIKNYFGSQNYKKLMKTSRFDGKDQQKMTLAFNGKES